MKIFALLAVLLPATAAGAQTMVCRDVESVIVVETVSLVHPTVRCPFCGAEFTVIQGDVTIECDGDIAWITGVGRVILQGNEVVVFEEQS